ARPGSGGPAAAAGGRGAGRPARAPPRRSRRAGRPGCRPHGRAGRPRRAGPCRTRPRRSRRSSIRCRGPSREGGGRLAPLRVRQLSYAARRVRGPGARERQRSPQPGRPAGDPRTEIPMPSVKVRENEPFEFALRRFKRTCEKAGVLAETRKREYYEKPTQERKRKAAAAVKRQARRVARDVTKRQRLY